MVAFDLLGIGHLNRDGLSLRANFPQEFSGLRTLPGEISGPTSRKKFRINFPDNFPGTNFRTNSPQEISSKFGARKHGPDTLAHTRFSVGPVDTGPLVWVLWLGTATYLASLWHGVKCSQGRFAVAGFPGPLSPLLRSALGIPRERVRARGHVCDSPTLSQGGV